MMSGTIRYPPHVGGRGTWRPSCSRLSPASLSRRAARSAIGALCSEAAAASCEPRGRDRQYASLSSALTRSEEHTSELQSHHDLVCRLLLEKKKKQSKHTTLQIKTPKEK